jgi:DNA polymerase elongation subunit (family B)
MQVRRGVVPVILERLVATRKKVKVEMEAAGGDPLKYYLLDCRQNALKITCNSIYGAIGCKFALLPLPDIAKTVTGLGRRHIMEVKATAERLFTVANGYERNAEVAGGDTDSVFVDMPVAREHAGVEIDAVAEAFRMAEILAKAVNETLKHRAPMKIEVEKVYSRLLLMLKKRYAGLKYKEGEIGKPPTVDIKGVECVRRDGCPLVRTIVYDLLVLLVSSGNVEEAGGVVRERVQHIMTDSLPLSEYVIKKTLRKDPMSCMEPLTNAELCILRSVVGAGAQPPLTYAELDEAIRMGLVGKGGASAVNLRWKQKLPQVLSLVYFDR